MKRQCEGKETKPMVNDRLATKELVVVIGSLGWQIWFTVGGDMIQEEVTFRGNGV